jgi:hypothetical protein
MLYDMVSLQPAASFARTEKLNVPADVGVPLIKPPDESDSPAGREPPAREKLTGAMAPLVEIESE